jgi:flagellar hook assembly protein FlgD
VTASFTPEAPYRVKIAVYNSAGELVGLIAQGLAVYQQPSGLEAVQSNFVPDSGGLGSYLILGSGNGTGSSSPVSFQWDGKNSQGQMVSSGSYLVKVEVEDNFEHITTFDAVANVVRQEAGAKVEIYNSAGELVKKLDLPKGKAGSTGLGLSLSSPSISSGKGLTITAGSLSVTWDGMDDQGDLVQSGQYVVKLTRTSGQGQVEVFTEAVTVLDAQQNSLSDAKVVPNPSAGSGPITVVLVSGPSTSLNVHVEIYDLAGELVANLDNGGNASSISWDPGKASSGIYVIRLKAKSPQGQMASRTLKAVLLR